MKQISNTLSKPKWGTRAFAVLVLAATTAIALWGQTPAALFKFDGTDGSGPLAALIQATNRDFYGTTSAGGDGDQGTVFKITASGTLTVLYRFCSQSECPDGSGPTAGLVRGTNGDFYGTTQVGGTYVDYGTVFQITPSGKLTTLHSFDGTDGAGPVAALVQDSNGNLYGTTLSGGAHDAGTVFEITPGGTFTSLNSFCSQSGCADGKFPYAALVLGSVRWRHSRSGTSWRRVHLAD